MVCLVEISVKLQQIAAQNVPDGWTQQPPAQENTCKQTCCAIGVDPVMSGGKSTPESCFLLVCLALSFTSIFRFSGKRLVLEMFLLTCVEAELAPCCHVIHVGDAECVAEGRPEPSNDPAAYEHDQVQRELLSAKYNRTPLCSFLSYSTNHFLLCCISSWKSFSDQQHSSPSWRKH